VPFALDDMLGKQDIFRRSRTTGPDVTINRETVNDAMKLMMHRLISRRLALDPSLVTLAKKANQKNAERFPEHSFVGEWEEILSLPPSEIRAQLVSKNSKMVRLRSSSPFVDTGLDFTNYDLRIRIGRAAKRVVQRRFSKVALMDGFA
jgi:hypothetical protein